ncbi:MAG: type II secretion system minor pseudopilin GspH [Gammaproteobacteria bacterium]
MGFAKSSAMQRGFTLFEIIVVVFIIGVIVSFASLSVSQHGDRYVEDEAKRLHHLMRLASEEAVLRGQELALLLTSTQYSFAELAGSKWEPMEDDSFFRTREFPQMLDVKLYIDDQEVNLSDREQPAKVYLLSSGEITPFTLTLSDAHGDAIYRVTGTLTGQIEYLQPGSGEDANA